MVSDARPTTLRFDVVNAFDTTYVIRDGSGIGVFARNTGRGADSSLAFRRSCEPDNAETGKREKDAA